MSDGIRGPGMGLAMGIRQGHEHLQAQNQVLRNMILGASEAVTRMRQFATLVGPVNEPVLLQGETGSGKDVLAKAIHFCGGETRPFVMVDGGVLPEHLTESMLFGHRRGAFTGATEMQRGLAEEADGGTLYIDEVGNMPPVMQAKFLRLVEDGTFRGIGYAATSKTSARIIVATNMNLERAVREGKFRQDLYHRISVLRHEIPPLRERKADVMVLAQHFLAAQSDKLQKRGLLLSKDAIPALEGYHWPGNVRELANSIRRAVLFAQPGGTIDASVFTDYFVEQEEAEPVPAQEPAPVPAQPATPANAGPYDTFASMGQMPTWNEVLRGTQEAYVREILRRTRGNIKAASRIAGVNNHSIHNWVNTLGLQGYIKELKNSR